MVKTERNTYYRDRRISAQIEIMIGKEIFEHKNTSFGMFESNAKWMSI